MIIFKNSQGVLLTLLSWTAPTQDTDGNEILYSMSYQLYVDSVAILTFPGTLNPDGRYQFPIADVPALQVPGEYSLTLTAFPDESPELESDPSNSVSLFVMVAIVNPKAPADVSLE